MKPSWCVVVGLLLLSSAALAQVAPEWKDFADRAAAVTAKKKTAILSGLARSKQSLRNASPDNKKTIAARIKQQQETLQRINKGYVFAPPADLGSAGSVGALPGFIGTAELNRETGITRVDLEILGYELADRGTVESSTLTRAATRPTVNYKPVHFSNLPADAPKHEGRVVLPYVVRVISAEDGDTPALVEVIKFDDVKESLPKKIKGFMEAGMK